MNLDFIKSLSSPGETTHAAKSHTQPDNQANSMSSGSSVSSVSQATCPPTAEESLRKRFRNVDKLQAESQATETSSFSTTESTVTETTQHTAGRLSTSSAKFRELDAMLLRQKHEADQAAAKVSERLSTIERQLYRINDMDQKLSEVQNNIAGRFNLFEDRLLDTTKEHLGQSGSNMALMESRMEKLLSFVEGAREKPSPRARTDDEMQDSVLDELAITAIADDTNTLSHSESTACEGNDSRVSEESRSSSSSSGVASMDAESVCRIQSPEHKRQRSSRKKKLSDSIRRHLDNQHFSSESNSVANMSNDTNT